MLCDQLDEPQRRPTRALASPAPGRDRLDAESFAEAASTMLFHRALVTSTLLPPDDRDIVTFYFVTPHDVIRHYRRHDRLSAPAGDDFGTFHRWGAVSYFEQFVVNPGCDTYRSRVYIDYAGAGLIRTTCRRIRERSDERPGQLSGVVCVDQRIRQEEVTGQLAESELVNHRIVAYDLADGVGAVAGCSVVALSEGNGAAQSLRVVLGPEDRLARVTPVSVGCRADPPQRETARIVTPVTELSLHGEAPIKNAWLLPLGVGEDGERRAMVIWAQEGVPRVLQVWSLVTALLVLMTVWVMFMAARRVHREGMADRVRSVIRCLQVGVTTEDSNDRIIDANDRAEEVLGVPLPKLGADAEPEHSWNFSSLIEPVIVEHLEGDVLRAARYAEAIPRKRALGSPSAYFARLRTGEGEGAWIRVMGSPLFLFDEASQDVAAPSMFGVVERAPEDERLARVRRVYDEATQARFLWSKEPGMLRALNDASWDLLAERDLLAPRGEADHGPPRDEENTVAIARLLDLDTLVAIRDDKPARVGPDEALDLKLPATLYAHLSGSPGAWFVLRVTRGFEIEEKVHPTEPRPEGVSWRSQSHAVITLRPRGGRDLPLLDLSWVAGEGRS